MTAENLREESKHLFGSGHTACAGCGQAIAARLVVDVTGKNTIITNNTGCLEVFSTKYPESAWGVPWIHSLFENAAAVASGVEAALKYLGTKDKITVISQAGDGGTADIGLQALSGMWERGHDVLAICLPPETELILGDGSIVEMGVWIDKIVYENKPETSRLLSYCRNITSRIPFPNFYYKECINSNLMVALEEEADVEIAPVRNEKVLSWNGAQFLPMNIISVQKKLSSENLIKITTASGRTLSLTPEHPVLIDSSDGHKWQRADLLKVKDEVYAPRQIRLNVEKEFYILDFLDESIKISLPLEMKEKINQELKKYYGSVKEAARTIGFKHWQMKERGRAVDLGGLRKIFSMVSSLRWQELRENITKFCVQGGKLVEVREKKFTSDLLYILGLISSDGYLIDKGYAVGFTNKESVLIKGFKKRYLKLFSGRKIWEGKNKAGITKLVIANPVISLLGKRLQIKFDPKELLRLPEELISAFLRGFFDGDGYCGITKGKHSYDAKVIFSTVDEKLAKRLRQMLQRIGIACFQDSRENRFDLIISSREDIKRFIERVSTNHPLQQKRIKEIKKLWKTRAQRGRFFSIAPKICGKILKDICEKEGVAITKLDKKRNIYSLAAGSRRATKQRIKKYKEDLLRLVGKERVGLFESLEPYLREDFYLDPIEKIEIVHCKSKFVYDITVEGSHLFVPEAAFIVSNCYDNEAYENTGIQRSGLTPYGANTTTTPPGIKSMGNLTLKKPMPEIALAHGLPYVATASVGYPRDIQNKIKKAISIKGPKYIQIHVPCPLGWRHDPQITYDIGKLAVETGLYPLIEYEYGKLAGVRKLSKIKPVEEYLKFQGRFKHILSSPEQIKQIQAIADSNIERYGLRAGPAVAPSEGGITK